jgi:hypothetical protein
LRNDNYDGRRELNDNYNGRQELNDNDNGRQELNDNYTANANAVTTRKNEQQRNYTCGRLLRSSGSRAGSGM